jgi:hypothetical protein
MTEPRIVRVICSARTPVALCITASSARRHLQPFEAPLGAKQQARTTSDAGLANLRCSRSTTKSLDAFRSQRSSLTGRCVGQQETSQLMQTCRWLRLCRMQMADRSRVVPSSGRCFNAADSQAVETLNPTHILMTAMLSKSAQSCGAATRCWLASRGREAGA